MRWQGRRQSRNVEDRRGESIGGAGGGQGGAMLLRLLPALLGRRGGKFGLVLILLLVGAQYLRVDLASLLTGAPAARVAAPAPNAAEDELAQFVSVVLADTEETWHTQFAELGKRYEEPRLVLFRGQVRSACGLASAAVGPFYCPADRQIYIDLSFYADLRARFGAPGDFAQAYVIAHEVGHHLQTLLGISGKVRAAQQQAGAVEANRLSVRLELQADCLAGVWAHHAHRVRDLLEPGDLDEALRAAAAIGDDRLQQQGQGRVVPDSFTHGSSAQRVRWFRTGWEAGRLAACDTFAARDL